METGKVDNLVCSLTNKKEKVLHIKTLKLVLRHGLFLPKEDRVTKFNQKAYNDMNTKF